MSIQPLSPGISPNLPSKSQSTSINGSLEDAIERFKINEICQGFPCHRDACEWDKMRDLFAEEDAFVFTTWSGGVPIDEFIEISAKGFANGVKIAHRANGCTVDIANSGLGKGVRGLGKLKATITQRFIMEQLDGSKCEVDVDADCTLCFFVELKKDAGWKIHFFKGIYHKDKATPVQPGMIPYFDPEKLSSFPDGYKYLAYGQSRAYKIKTDLPQSNGVEHDTFYDHFISWLEGTSIEKMKILLQV